MNVLKWLLSKGVAPNTIYAVSFTRAATDDLRKGIHSYCTAIPEVSGINVSTLHSLALSILARGGQLTQYATSPRILDDWEQRNIFDEELKKINDFPIKNVGNFVLTLKPFGVRVAHHYHLFQNNKNNKGQPPIYWTFWLMILAAVFF